VTYEVMHLAADEALTMFACTAERGSKSEEALHRLASWAATFYQARTARSTDEAASAKLPT
jgi:hypothetical protein